MVGAVVGEVRAPLTEEEVAVEKRPVTKKELRIRKAIVEDTEVVEEDLGREDIDIDDDSTKLNLSQLPHQGYFLHEGRPVPAPDSREQGSSDLLRAEDEKPEEQEAHGRGNHH